MPVQWTPDLSTKVEAIDDQHRELFRQLDLLLKAWHAGKGRDEVEKILQLLDVMRSNVRRVLHNLLTYFPR